MLRRSAGMLSAGAFLAACGGSSNDPGIIDAVATIEEAKAAPTNVPAPTATPEPPFVLPAGEAQVALMPGTPQETPLYVYGSGRLGPIVMALGGVHGNEPGGWFAAERVQKTMRPATGGLLVLPRANKLAINLFERTTDALGDLNRAYPGDPNGKPMFQMAAQIIDVLRNYHVDLLIDMHESWAFFDGRPQNGTAFLGQTVSTFANERSIALARGVVDAVNTRIQHPRERFFYRDSPNRAPTDTSTPQPGPPSGTPGPTGGISTSSLGIPRWVPGLDVFLVEMGQQQAESRRIDLHVEIFAEAWRQVGGEIA